MCTLRCLIFAGDVLEGSGCYYSSGESLDQTADKTRIAVHLVFRRLSIPRLIIIVTVP